VALGSVTVGPCTCSARSTQPLVSCLGGPSWTERPNEINAFSPLLDRIDIAGVIVTADALHTQRGHVSYLLGRSAHYLLTVKGNQPTLDTQLRALPWMNVPVVDLTTGKGHGRVESRSVKITTVRAGLAFPCAAQAIQITRRRRALGRPAGRARPST